MTPQEEFAECEYHIRLRHHYPLAFAALMHLNAGQEQCAADAERAARIITRARELLAAGRARGWSHAISIAKKEVSE